MIVEGSNWYPAAGVDGRPFGGPALGDDNSIMIVRSMSFVSFGKACAESRATIGYPEIVDMPESVALRSGCRRDGRCRYEG